MLQTTVIAIKELPMQSYARATKNRKWLRAAMYMYNPANRSVNLGFLRNLPGLRKWVGNRKVYKISDEKHLVTAIGYEETVGVHRKDAEENNLAEPRKLAAIMGQDAAVKPVDELLALLNACETTLCYDGQYFVDTDHPSGKTGVINANTQDGTGTTLAQLSADWAAACIRMAGFQIGLTSEDDTRVLDQEPNAVFCHTSLAAKFKQIFGLKTIDLGSGPVENPLYGAIPLDNIFSSSKITLDSGNSWWAAYVPESNTADPSAEGAENDAIGPFLFMENEKFNSDLNGDKESLWQSDEFQIGGKTYFIVAPLAWFHIILVYNR